MGWQLRPRRRLDSGAGYEVVGACDNDNDGTSGSIPSSNGTALGSEYTLSPTVTPATVDEDEA